MAEQAYAYVTLIPVAKGFQSAVAKELSGLGGVGGGLGQQAGAGFSGGFGKALKGLLGPITATLSTVAVANFTKSAVGAASAFSAEFEGVNQTFGSAAKAVQNFADQAAYSAGISETEALRAAKNFGGFALAAGLAGTQAATFSTDLVQAAGDLASFNDVPVDQALSAIQSGLAGQSEPLRNFRIFLDEATLSAQAAKMGFDGTFASLSQGEKTMVRQSAIMDQLGVQAGDFQNYAGTFGNVLKTVQATFQELQAQVGAALLPALEQLLPELLPIIDMALPVLLDMFDALVPVILAVAENLGPLFQALMPLFDALSLIIEALAPILEQFLPIFVEILGMLTPLVLQLVQAFLPLIEKLLPPFVDLINALLPLLDDFINFLSAYIIPLLETLGSILGDVVIGAMNFLTDAFKNLRSALGPVWEILKPMVEGLMALAGIKPGSLNKTIKISTTAEDKRLAALKPGSTGASALGSMLTGAGPLGGGGGKKTGPTKAQIKKQISGYIKETKKALKDARKEYDTAITEANNAFALREGEIYENYNIAVARATTQRDADLARAIQDNTKRVSEIRADFAKRLDDIVKESMNRLRDVYKSAVEINVAEIFNGDVVAGSIDGTIEMMREKLAASRQLLANAAALSAAGFSQTFIEQVVGAGTEVGNELASSILNATPEQREEMKTLFGAIEQEASHGMDQLAQTIYDKNGLATEELRNLYAMTQAELVTALAEQEATYQAEMAQIMATFDQAILDAKIARDEALEEAEADLEEALLKANESFLEDLTKIEGQFKSKISSMKGEVAGMLTQISNLNSAISGARSNAATATAEAAAAVAATAASKLASAAASKTKGLTKLATGGLVTGPTEALVGEAGPELVIPLDKFESWMGMDGGMGKSLNYYAAPNTSLDSEQELFQAMKRAKVVVGW